MKMPALDVVRLETWLRGDPVKIDGYQLVFPHGRKHFVDVLAAERMRILSNATEKVRAKARL
jgi:hypothetical protein